jgi:anaerobic magnesium-protoporphyrin IX monomethyl ester cyclase
LVLRVLEGYTQSHAQTAVVVLEGLGIFVKDLRITLVELPATVDGRLDGRMAKDVYSLFRYPARGVPLLEAICRRAGYEDTVTLDLQYNRVPGRLDVDDWKRLAATDVLGLSVITRTAKQSFELARRVRAVNPRVKILFGGPHPTALPEESLQFGDVVVTHEGDYTLPLLLERLEDNLRDPYLTDLLGVNYLGRDSEIIRNPDRPYLSSEELSALPFPVYSDHVNRGITHNVVNTSRGCPYECEFCSVIENFGRGFRFLSDDAAVALIRHTIQLNGKPIFFGDDIFAANRARTTRLLERLLSEGVKMPRWFAQVRVETAQDQELLRLMKRANCAMVFIGLESVNEETLKLFKKHSTLEKNRQAIAAFNEAGIRVHGMFVLGSDADTPQTLTETLKFARDSRLTTAQFFALTAVPGPPLTRRLAEEKRIVAWGDWQLFDAQHAVVCPSRISPSELQAGIFRISRRFYSVSEALRHLIHGRWYDFAIRLQGSFLARRIERDSASYARALDKFDRVRADLAAELDELAEKARTKLRGFSVGLEDGQAQAKAYFQDLFQQFEFTCDQLNLGLVPYGQALREMASKKLEKHLRALTTEPLERTSSNLANALDTLYP